MGLFNSIRGYLDALVHPSALNDDLAAARHRAFIGPRLIGPFVALAAFPAYLAVRGAPSGIEIVLFCWLAAPILTAYFLSRTGQYENAHILSSFALTGLVTFVAFKTGGITSTAAIWLVVVPLEAALSASRRAVAIASLCALAAAAFLILCDIYQWLPQGGFEMPHGTLATLGIVSAILYAAGLALGVESLARKSFWLRYTEEDRYRLLARNVTDVITRHGANGSVLFASPTAETLFGTHLRDLMGHGLFDRVHVADRPAYLKALNDACGGDGFEAVQFRCRRDETDASGKPVVRFIWVEMRCRLLDQTATVHDGASKEIVAVLRDISERKSQEQAIEEARADAERANTAKGRFIATMSHELRTPLNVIIGFSEMLQRETEMQIDSARRVDYARLINDSGQHLLSVVNGILDMSKLDTGEFVIQPEPFALAPVISTCCSLFELKASKADVTISQQISHDLPEINADQRALKQILINLLSNAIKFTNSGGHITVGARTEQGCVLISVDDNGIGVSAEDLPRLGNPFFQARGSYDRRHDGTGLGLSIVRGLVTLHGGDLLLRSELGKGTSITVRLPIDCDTARPKSAGSVHDIRENAAPRRQDAAGTHKRVDDGVARISA